MLRLRKLVYPLVAAAAIAAYGQQTTGSILGVALDAQGLVVSNARVTARNTETGLARPAQTNDRGEYRIDFLPPGS
jgi:hypothetical protein